MKDRLLLFIVGIGLLISGCSVSKNYMPDKKYPSTRLKSDFSLLRNILETKHPSLYWYTSKDSMDKYFDWGYNHISDSMTELQFGWQILAPLLSKIHCGHTSFNMSKGWYKFIRNKKIPSFPLFLKVWNDTMVVEGNLNKQDSMLKKGTVITSINGLSNKDLLAYMFSFLPQDGFENNLNNMRLSTGFPFYHRNIFGLYKRYSVKYLDSTGAEKKAYVPYYNPLADSLNNSKDSIKKIKHDTSVNKLSKKLRLIQLRSLKINEQESTANMELYTFSKSHLKRFFRHSFRTIKKKHIQNLILDIRGNGGGDINNYVALTRYLRKTNFKVSDTTFASTRSLAPYTKYIRSGFFINLGLLIFTHKKNEQFHFRYWERHSFKPKQNNHFNGNIYVLSNGYTFSASSLFCNAIKGQDNVKIVGENTGGGWYGNSGIFLPEIILPNTKLRIRLPLFRIVNYDHIGFKGTGVIPDVRVMPTVEAVQKNVDLKILKVKELIKENNTIKSFKNATHSVLHQ